MGSASVLLGLVVIVGILSSSIASQQSSDPGQPLFLTRYIEEGRIFAAREASRVPSLVREDNVESYSGYLTVNKGLGSNMFFWFFPAENNPAKAPVALWLQGGPGGASLFATFTENGPFVLTKDLNLEKRQNYWSQELNMIYIDNPVGAGFSYTEHESGYAKDETMVGENLYAALVQFFQLFPEFQRNEFFITGESYAGKYIPALAHTIHEKNPSASLKINLAGFAIGDGWVDPRNMMVYSNYLYQHGLIDDQTMMAMKQYENETAELIDAGKYHEASLSEQRIWTLVRALSGPIDQYDFTVAGQDVNMAIDLDGYLNQAHVKKSLHVGPNNFSMESEIVSQYLFDDVFKSVAPWFEELLDEYRVMLYNGQLDIICAYPLTVNFVKQLKWSGAQDYLKAPRTKWYVGNELAGYTKTVGKFTEVLVRNAGHMVPANQPVWALDLITRFTQNLPFDKSFSA